MEERRVRGVGVQRLMVRLRTVRMDGINKNERGEKFRCTNSH